jgi:hypothetical protein
VSEVVQLMIPVVVHQIVSVMSVPVVRVEVSSYTIYSLETIFFLALTCFDGVLNEDETAIDCGGVCLGVRSCATNDSCSTATDCISNVCTGSMCQGKLVQSL